MTAALPHRDLPGWSADAARGLFRRRVEISAGDGVAQAALEDDVHRFSVALAHDGRVATRIGSAGERYPYNACVGAGPPLERVVGAALDLDVTALARWTRAGEHCTHRFDLVALALAQAARGPGEQRYDIAVASEGGRPHRATLDRNRVTMLDWTLDGLAIRAAGLGDGQDVRTVLRWAQSALAAEPDAVEAVFVMRRGILVAHARLHDPADFVPRAAMPTMGGACFVFQPGVVETAAPVPDNYRDFDAAPDRLLGRMD